MIASRQTSEAREDLRIAREEWDDHRRDCIDCTRAARKRKTADRCDDGTILATEARDAEKRWQHEQELDAAPAPGQEVLF